MRLSLILLVKPKGIPPSRDARTPDAGAACPALAGGVQAAAGYPARRSRRPPRPLRAHLPRLPHGVGHDQTSARLKGVAVLFAVLG